MLISGSSALQIVQVDCLCGMERRFFFGNNLATYKPKHVPLSLTKLSNFEGSSAEGKHPVIDFPSSKRYEFVISKGTAVGNTGFGRLFPKKDSFFAIVKNLCEFNLRLFLYYEEKPAKFFGGTFPMFHQGFFMTPHRPKIARLRLCIKNIASRWPPK